jgi:hypothetical protein
MRRPKLGDCSTLTSQIAFTCTATTVVAPVAHSASRLDLIRSPKRVLDHFGEGLDGEE